MCNPIREFKSRPPHFPFRAMRSHEKTEKIVQLRGFETETSVNLKMNPKPKPISSDIYNWETRYNSTLDRLKNDSRISERNRVRLKGFLESRCYSLLCCSFLHWVAGLSWILYIPYQSITRVSSRIL